MTDKILTTENRKSIKTKYAGGKGANLAKLTKAGFPVPQFFIISTSVYQKFIQYNRLKLSQLKEMPSYKAKLQDQIITSSIENNVSILIEDAFNKLLNKSVQAGVAVRSSATVEDQYSLSFAGQFESYTNVRDVSQLLVGIKKCWASLWNDKVLQYLINHNLPPPRVLMAVIVQRMIPAQASGVVFTVNPINSNNLEMVIEVSRGLGKKLVGGRTIPESYILSKFDFTTYRKGGSNTSTGILNNSQLKQLGKLCIQIEKYFNTPQDIEWSFHNNKFFILQTRPITTLSKKTIWTNYFFAERFPQPISPLGWSVIKEPIERNAFLEPLHFLGFHNLARKKITRFFYGRPYTDLSVFKAIHSCFPTSFVSEDKRIIFYDKDVSIIECLKNIFKRILPILTILCQTNNWIIPLHLRNWLRFIKRYEKIILQLNKIDLKKYSLKQIFNIHQTVKKLTFELLNLHRWSITFAELIYHFIPRYWVTDDLIAQLHTGISGNKTVAMNIDLWRLAQKSNDDEKSIATFLQKYGHRSNSLDIFFPTWAEDIDYIKQLIEFNKNMPDPAIIEHKNKLLRLEKTAKIFKKGTLKFPYSHIVKILLPWSQQLILLRENQRFHWHQSLAIMRKVFLEIGNRFKQQKLIEDSRDIFFLTEEEINNIINSEVTTKNILALIKLRKEKFERYRSMHAPKIIVENDFVKRQPITNGNLIFYGIGVSSGSARGSACVLTDLKGFRNIEEGDILVTPTTDPGWTPLFSNISGLITEVGGILSHGSIVAREYGIPAVTNLTNATQIIKSGDYLEIDGNKGIVKIENR